MQRGKGTLLPIMAKWKEGDKVKVVTRTVTEDDRKTNRYFDHMAGLVGTIQNIYGPDQIAVKVDKTTLSAIARDVNKEATMRMRTKFTNNISEEQRKQLSPEELEFDTNTMILVRGEDLEKA